PSDIVRIRHHGLTLNFTGELERAEVYCKAGPDARRADWLRRSLVPEIEPALVPGLDPCALPFDALRQAYSLATARPRFPALTAAARASVTSPFAAVREEIDRYGSNNWAIAPARSETGRAVLASDPHRD